MQKKNLKKSEKQNRIPERKCDTFLLIDKVKLPVWILPDHFAVVATLSNGSEVVYAGTGNFKNKDVQADARAEIEKAIAELKVEGLTFAELQKTKYYA
jgi:hypothetical protein